MAECRLALLLAIDVSASVDPEEDGLQRGGLAAALLAPEVVDGFLADPDSPVVLAVYEWSGRFAQDVILWWKRIETAEDLEAAARAIGESERGRDDLPTAIGDALGFGASLFHKGPDCRARTLDVAGDGIGNDGFPPSAVYRAGRLDGVVVNGLAIQGGEQDVAAYYREEMIRGPGAFVIEADGFGDYERAMREKLFRELSGMAVSAIGPFALPEGAAYR
ncbi:MAG: DUF1194 domain-containing protein [Albidovulum sp.]